MTPRLIVASLPHHVQQVIRLGDRNSHHLGHFPEAAYIREASNGRIIAAVDEQDAVLGYVLFRTTRDRAVVQHLCVDEMYRGRGTARMLVDELKRRTRHLPAIVCHCAREFSEIDVWKKLGFVPIGEKKGRGADQRPLIRLAFDHGHPHLFSGVIDELVSSTVVAVMDVNVCVHLQDQLDNDPEIEALRSDWLLEEVSLWVTDEAMAEVGRQDDAAERLRRMAFVRGYNAVRRDVDQEDRVYAQLRGLLGHDHRPQDRADLRQLAQAICGGADVFLTRDNRLLRHADAVAAHFDLDLLRPADLVVRLDELSRVDDYAPVRLHGSAIEARLVREEDLDRAVNTFLNHSAGETRKHLSDLIRQHVATPKRSVAMVVSGDNQSHRALLLMSWSPSGSLHISAMRLLKDRLADTLARHLLSLAIQHARAQGCCLVTLDDRFPIYRLESALRTLGFRPSQDGWVKISLHGLIDRTEIVEAVIGFGASHTGLLGPMKDIERLCQSTDRTDHQDAGIEQIIWPGRLRNSVLPNYVVPIRPRFARNLFDKELAGQAVFGGDPALLLNCENVYYRSSHIEIITAPARVLWYVTADAGECVRQLRAVSSVLTTEVGTAKDLFRKYRQMGVYEWGHVRDLASGDPEGEIMAIRFGPTDCFTKPIPGAQLKRLIQQARGSINPPPLTMPVEIPSLCFEALCELAYDR